jgi:hypothetical protein
LRRYSTSLPYDDTNLKLAVNKIGGYQSGTIRKALSVECYDPHSDRWNYVPPLNCEHCAGGAVVLNNRIFVGGSFDPSEYIRQP